MITTNILMTPSQNKLPLPPISEMLFYNMKELFWRYSFNHHKIEKTIVTLKNRIMTLYDKVKIK